MRMKKVYITDFCEDLNYTNVVLHIDDSFLEQDWDDLLDAMRSSNLSHMYRFDMVRGNRLFYVENCDLQDVTLNKDWDELYELLQNDYRILQLKRDSCGFYVPVPDIF